MVVCPVCGNDNDGLAPICRFCGGGLHPEVAENRLPAIIHRTVNLKIGRPVVDTALRRMKNELDRAALLNVKVLTLIHGYGSSGKGGKIREECRKVLSDLCYQGRLRTVLPGEQFSRRHGVGKALLRRFPLLEQECGPSFGNPGVTIVEL